MPIRKATAFTASDGSLHASIDNAVQHELELLYKRLNKHAEDDPQLDERARGWAANVWLERDAILDILTTGPRSRPAARKAKGTTAPRRAAKTAATTEQVKAGFKALRQSVEAGVSTLTSETLDKAEKAAGLTPVA